MVASIQGMGSMRGMSGMQAPKPLTAEQQKSVQDILSNYDARNISTDDAKSIVKSLKEVGVRGPAMRDALTAAGFDAGQIRSMAHDGHQHVHSGGQGQSAYSSSAMQSLTSIMSQYDLGNMSSSDQKDLYSQLTSSGLLKTGASGVWNTTA